MARKRREEKPFDPGAIKKVDIYPENGTDHLERVRKALGLQHYSEAVNIFTRCCSGAFADMVEGMAPRYRQQLLQSLAIQANLPIKSLDTLMTPDQIELIAAWQEANRAQVSETVSTPPARAPGNGKVVASPAVATKTPLVIDDDDDDYDFGAPSGQSGLDKLSSLFES